MAIAQTEHAPRARLFSLLIGGIAVFASVAYLAGGEAWLLSPAIWGTLAVVTAVAATIVRARRHPVANLLLGLPIVAGGSIAIVAGAWDYLPWLTSPWLWLGGATSGAIGAWLVRSRQLRARDAIEGIALGTVVFTIGWVALLAAVVFVSVVWRPT